MNTQYTDERLLDLIREGDHAAFREVHRRYHETLFTIAFNKLKDISRSEDAVQDVFVFLWENRSKRTVTTLEHYLATAIKYRCFRIISDMNRITFSAETLPQEDDTIQVEDLMSLKSLEEILAEETNKLPNQCRIVFVLSRHMGMNNEEIAHELNISRSAVKNHLTKALNRLRNRLKIIVFFLFLLFKKKIFFFGGGLNAVS